MKIATDVDRLDRKIIIVGAGGYLGSRLYEALSEVWPNDVFGYDLGIWGKARLPDGVQIKDVTDLGEGVWRNNVVVWLASFHREPENLDRCDRSNWIHAYRKLMVTAPLRVSQFCHQLIYTSSMRSLTDRQLIYSKVKNEFERHAISRPEISTVRFGTVWGGFHETFANRTETAVNYAILNNRFEGNHWSAYTTHMQGVLTALTTLSLRASMFSKSPPGADASADIYNCTDGPRPMTAADVRSLLAGDFAGAIQLRFNDAIREAALLDPGAFLGADAAKKNLWDYYGVKP